jgi:hypothetical protein
VRLGAPFAADPFWNGIFLADLAFYVTVAALVKLTPWLDERRGGRGGVGDPIGKTLGSRRS